MYSTITHECGGHAHLVGQSLAVGWNLYCCNRCGATFYKWITKQMTDVKPRYTYEMPKKK